VSRRGPEGPITAFIEPPEGDSSKIGLGPQNQRLDMDSEGFTIYLKINYKVVLLIVMILDLFHASVNEFLIHVFRI